MLHGGEKNAYISLPFLGDTYSAFLRARLNKVVSACYPAARVIVRWYTTKAFHSRMKDVLPFSSTASVVYRFVCNCEDAYVGRTEATIGQRVRQHIPKWLDEGKKERPRSKQAPTSSIARHILSCRCYDGPALDHFTILHKGHSKMLNSILEALEIKATSPVLCVQKEFVFNLKLPWT